MLRLFSIFWILFIYSFIHYIYLYIYLFIIYLLTYLFIYLFIYSFIIYLFTYLLFTYLLIFLYIYLSLYFLVALLCSGLQRSYGYGRRMRRTDVHLQEISWVRKKSRGKDFFCRKKGEANVIVNSNIYFRCFRVFVSIVSLLLSFKFCW